MGKARVKRTVPTQEEIEPQGPPQPEKGAPSGIGLCIKSQLETVEFQNQACVEVCGDQKGKRCEKGCMHRYSAGPVEGRIFDNAYKIFRNVEVDSFTVDAIMINDGEKLTTLLYDRAKIVNKQVNYLQQFKLSKTEIKVMELYLKGFSNQEIANKLFISKGTLRSHLNSVYKKIPAPIKDEILATHRQEETKKKI